MTKHCAFGQRNKHSLLLPTSLYIYTFNFVISRNNGDFIGLKPTGFTICLIRGVYKISTGKIMSAV